MSAQPKDGTVTFRVGPYADPDRYALGVAVGSGAEGILYRGSITTATGVHLDVAIKMLQPRFLSRVEEWHSRWTEQVELLRSLHVPGVVPVRDGFLGPLPHPPGQSGEGRTLYLVMNWVEGESLDEWIRHRPDRDPIDDLKLLVPVAAALDLMHSGQLTGGVPIVHRDVKPSNIVVTDQGAVLVDFGLTRGLPDGQRLTGVVGTPGYLAPETTDAGIYSPATDGYAFGAVAYFVLTGFEPPTSHQPEVLRTLLAAVPVLAQRLEVVDRMMTMLDTEPARRPTGLANWIGQLRHSSLDAGPDILNPQAPRRHPTALGHRLRETARNGISRPRTAILSAGALMAALVVSALFTTSLLAGSTQQPHKRVANQLAFDPTCGQGQPVPFSVSPASVPMAAIVSSNHATVGTNSAEPLGPEGWIQGGLIGIDPNCSPDPTFAPPGEAISNLQPPSGAASLAALTMGPNGASYAAGSNQAGWVVGRYLPSGNHDPSFGSGGYVILPEPSPHSGGNGAASAISVAQSGEIFVFGSDSGAHCCGKSLLIALRGNGSLVLTFGNQGVVTTDLGPGGFGDLMTMTVGGRLLLGNNEGFNGSAGCDQFTIEEYRSSGTPESRFTKIVGSGTGSYCSGTTRMPGYDTAQLTSVLALQSGAFLAIGRAFSAAPQRSGASAFLVRYHANGSLDRSFGKAGIVTLPGLGNSMEQPVVVAERGGDVVVGMVRSAGLSLVLLAPSGGVDKRVQVPSPGPSPSFAMGDAGGGKILLVSEASGQWSVARYLGAGS